MSNKATAWAMEQRGLKPATKIVLWNLCDCHTPKLGCFPSQEYLAEASEMSRASVNTHLDILEGRGLIQRMPGERDPSGRQLRTRYILGFEEEAVSRIQTRPVSSFCAEPCPVFDEIRVQNLDSNFLKENFLKENSGNDLFSRQEPERQGLEIQEVAPSLPSLFPHPPRVSPAPPSPDPAAAFWAAYPTAPRKTDRPKAMALFAQIVAGKHKGIPKVDAWALVRAVQAYAATNPDPQFVPLPCTWLRGARWEAHTLEPAAAASGPRPESLEDRMRRARDEAQARRDALIAEEKARRRAGGGFQPIGQLAAEIVRRLV